MYKFASFVLFAVCIVLSAGAVAQDKVLVDLRNFHRQDLQYQGFALGEGENISIKVVGAGKDRPLWTRSWILNSETRSVVWDIRHATPSNEDRRTTTFTGNVSLPKGTYEVYYASFPYSYFSINGFSDFMDYLGDKVFRWNDKDEESSDDANGLCVVVTGNGTPLDKGAVEKLQEDYRKNSLFSFSGLWDNQSEHQGFVLDKPIALDVYAIGEVRPDGAFDYGWIKNTTTGKIVWTMTNRGLKHAGGDRKNRMVRETITLPAGTYAAFYVTDDSHSTRTWNAPPPFDPQFWGMTVRLAEPSAKQHVKLTVYEETPSKSIIVEMTRVRDKEYRSKGFTLKRAMNVRILAIGEGTDEAMYDFGWITDAKSNKKVWEMKYVETEHAGGSEKNRVVDRVIHLDKGNYVAYYVSDGSHNYHDWNGAPPYDQEHWGLTVFGTEESFSESDVAPYDNESDKSILACIVRVGDDERKSKHFTLDKETEVHIYALGEGRNGEMFDYGWVEDAKSGRTIWEMTYRMTEPAGGAEKNRRYDGFLTLKPGEYVVHYRSDDSHSFEGWNDDPPSDPFNWGITLSNAVSKVDGR